MQRLEIDFRRGRRASPWPGRLILAVAIACLGEAGYSYHESRQVAARLDAELARLQPQAAAGRTAPRASVEEVAAARETVERIGLPWASLFGALEAAATEQVALLGVEPDPKKGTVLISGEGKNYLAALTYVLNLSHEEALRDVQLVRHEAKTDDPQGPVSFAISAAWSGVQP